MQFFHRTFQWTSVGLTILSFNATSASQAAPMGLVENHGLEADILIAQIVPDRTLGSENSVVIPDVEIQSSPADVIKGGAIRGANLFHSFETFNVETGGRVYFANPIGIENILGRMTGSKISKIDGLLGVDGAANLFLLNPNGILFGPNAQLDLKGSFTASAAERLVFLDGSEFRVLPQGNALLTASVPLGVQYADLPVGNIENQGNLSVDTGQTLTLFGNTTLSSGTLEAMGGTVQILGNFVGLMDQARVDVSSATEGGLILVGGDRQGNGETPSAKRTFVGSNVELAANAFQAGNGGIVIVWADDTTYFAGKTSANAGALNGNGGFVEISGGNNLNFIGEVETQALNGSAGQLLLDPTNIRIAKTSQEGFTPVESGDAVFTDFFYAKSENEAQNSHLTPETVVSLLRSNDLTLEATDTIEIVDDVNNEFSDRTLTLKASKIKAVDAGIEQSRGGSITLETPQVIGNSVIISGERGRIVANNAQQASVGLDLDAGSVHVITHDLSLENGGKLDTSTGGNGNSGQVQVMASGDILVDGRGSSISSQVNANGVDDDGSRKSNSGGVNINAANLRVQNEGTISAITAANGTAGQVEIMAKGDVWVDGSGAEISNRVNSGAIGDGADLAITTNRLFVENGGKIDASTGGNGNSGQVQVIANGDIVIDGVGSSISSQVNSGGDGNSGGVSIKAANLRLQNEGEISASTASDVTPETLNNAGAVELFTTGDISVDGLNSAIVSEVRSGAVGNSGGIVIQTNGLAVQNQGSISTSTATGGMGNSGAVTIKANNITVRDSNNNISSRIASQVETGAIGNSDGLMLTTTDLFVENGGKVDASTGGVGNAGLLQVNAEGGEIRVNGVGSAIASQVNSGGDGTSEGIILSTNSLSVLQGGEVSTSTASDITPSTPNSSGSIKVTAIDNIVVEDDGSLIASQVETGAVGNSGGLMLTTTDLSIKKGGKVDTSTGGEGNSGTLQITAVGNILVDGDGSAIASQVNPEAEGDSGGITIKTGNLSVQKLGFVSTSNAIDPDTVMGGVGNSGSVEIIATGDVVVRGRVGEISSRIASQAQEGVTGASGRLTITAQHLIVDNGGKVDTSTGGTGNSGLLSVTANDITVDGDGSTIASQVNEPMRLESGGIGNSDGVVIATDRLSVQNQGQVTASTLNQGTAGNVHLTSHQSQDLLINLSGGGGIEAKTSSSAQGGSVNLAVPKTLRIQGEGRFEDDGQGGLTEKLTVESSSSTGLAGNINVEASSLILGGVELSAQTASVEGGGNINFFVDDLLILRRNSFVNAQSINATQGSASNINVDAGFVVAVPTENNDIIANAMGGDGGRIIITSNHLLGFTEQSDFIDTDELRTNSSSDLSASSQLRNPGVISITNLAPNPVRRLNVLPDQLNAPSVSRGCEPRGRESSSKYIETGRSGLPVSPYDSLTSSSVLEDVTPPSQLIAQSSSLNSVEEVEGWKVNVNGEVELVARSADLPVEVSCIMRSPDK